VAPLRQRLSCTTAALLGAIAICAVSSTVAALVARSVDRETEADARRAATSTGVAFDATLAKLRTRLGVADDLAEAPVDTLGASGVVAVIRVPLAGNDPDAARATVLRGTLPSGFALSDSVMKARSALELSRDTGDALAAAPIDGTVLVALPDFAGGADPRTTLGRRSALSSWVVAAVSAPELLRLTGATDLNAISLVIGGREVTGSAVGEPAVERAQNFLGQPWVLRLPVDGEPGLGGAATAVLLVGLLSAAVVLANGIRDGRLLAETLAATSALERETRAVAELGPLLQQKLDLGEVLPAVAVRLSDEFDLEHFGVELLGDRGEFVDAFAMGRRSPAGSVDLGQAGSRETIAAGVEFAVPLLRTGRVIGRLRMTSRQPLSATQLDTLRAAADLIAVATYNVDLYEREQANVQRLTELDRLKDGFLGTISHELRTPITAIGGFVQLLRRQWTKLSDAERLEFLERVQRNTTSLGFLVDDLLDFARLDRHALGITPGPLDISGAVSAMVEQLTPLLGDHDVELDVQPGVHGIADNRALERVLANLLTNAAKFSKAHTQICVSVEGGPTWVTIGVADQGPGIAPEERSRVFQRFYRGDGDAARSTRGAGIGLSVVHELVTQMGGTIDVEGREPQGTRMVVRLLAQLPAELRLPAQAPERVETRRS
jgi:signal transduction histidine kinase